MGQKVTAIAAALLMTATLATAQTSKECHIDWCVESSASGLHLAATKNQSGNSFGQVCDANDGNCAWVLYISESCKTGDLYPALLSSVQGAQAVNLKCLNKDEKSTYVFTEFDALETAIKTGDRLALVIPLPGLEFKVMRFSLSGSSRQIPLMQEKMRSVYNRSTADRKL